MVTGGGGILHTVVGYSGSMDDGASHPTYTNIQDYAESIRITYEPSVLTYEDLLEMFFAFHTPNDRNFVGSQYRSAIFYHTPQQRDMALSYLSKKGSIFERFVAVEEASDFYAAEEYHQKYLDKAMGKY